MLVKLLLVSPYIGEWIEIIVLTFHLSTPLEVSPYIGEWIEIVTPLSPTNIVDVSPYIGEWIEILFIHPFK